jgi:hypothetical protein
LALPYSKNKDEQFLTQSLQKLLQTEEAYQIFLSPSKNIYKDEILKIQIAKELEQLGLLDMAEEHSIPCVDPANESLYEHVPDSECEEIISIRPGAKPYSDADLVVCPNCGHEFFMSEHSQNITSFYSITAKTTAALAIFENCLSEQNIIWHKLDNGKYAVIYNSEIKTFAITDFFLKTFVENDWILFQFQVAYPLKKAFKLADFICKRRLFSEIWAPVAAPDSPKLGPQLVISPSAITLGGQSLISAQSTRQWQLFQLFLANQGKVLSLSKIAEILQKQGEIIDDYEQQIRKPINKIRTKARHLCDSNIELLSSSPDGYCLNTQLFSLLYIS